MAFTDLPPELILPILQLLGPEDMLRMRLLCRNLNRLILRHLRLLLSATDVSPWARGPSADHVPSDWHNSYNIERMITPNPKDHNTLATLMTDDLAAKILLEYVVDAARASKGQDFGGTELVRSIQIFCAGFTRMTGQGGGMMQEATKEVEENFRRLWMVPCMTVIGWKGRQWVMDELKHPGTHSDVDFDATLSDLLIATSYHLNSYLQLLLQNGKDPDIEHKIFGTPMYAAAYWDNPTAIQLLVNHRGKIGYYGHHHSPLKVAAYRGSSRALSALLAAGADIHYIASIPLGTYGSPLGAAAAKGHVDIVKKLLASKRSRFYMAAPDSRERGPLWWAVRGGHEEIVHLLVQNGVDADSSHGASAAREAVESRRHSIVRFLLSQPGSEVNPIWASTRLGRGLAPIHFAVREGDEELVRILIGRVELNPNIIDPSLGCTALYAAVERQQISIVSLLLQRNDVDPNLPERDGRTPLLRAVEDGNVETVELLLRRGDIDPNRGRLGPESYQTPLGRAVKRKDEMVAALLLRHPSIDPSVMSETEWF